MSGIPTFPNADAQADLPAQLKAVLSEILYLANNKLISEDEQAYFTEEFKRVDELMAKKLAALNSEMELVKSMQAEKLLAPANPTYVSVPEMCLKNEHQQFVGPSYHNQHVGPSYHNQHVGPSYHDQYVGPSYHDQYTGPSYHNQYVGPSHHNQYVGPSYHDQNVGPSYHNQYVRPSYQSQYVGPLYHNQYVGPSYQNQYVGPSYQNQYVAPSYQNQFATPSHQDQFDGVLECRISWSFRRPGQELVVTSAQDLGTATVTEKTIIRD